MEPKEEEKSGPTDSGRGRQLFEHYDADPEDYSPEVWGFINHDWGTDVTWRSLRRKTIDRTDAEEFAARKSHFNKHHDPDVDLSAVVAPPRWVRSRPVGREAVGDVLAPHGGVCLGVAFALMTVSLVLNLPNTVGLEFYPWVFRFCCFVMCVAAIFKTLALHWTVPLRGHEFRDLFYEEAVQLGIQSSILCTFNACPFAFAPLYLTVLSFVPHFWFFLRPHMPTVQRFAPIPSWVPGGFARWVSSHLYHIRLLRAQLEIFAFPFILFCSAFSLSLGVFRTAAYFLFLWFRFAADRSTRQTFRTLHSPPPPPPTAARTLLNARPFGWLADLYAWVGRAMLWVTVWVL